MNYRFPDTDGYPEQWDLGTPHQQLLRGVRIKATSGRLALIELLTKEKSPISASEMYKKIGSKYDLAGIYRTIKSLTKAGVIRRTDLGQTHARYELGFGRKHHHHVTCTECGDMEDVDYCPAAKVQSVISGTSEKFGAFTSHTLEFFGVCKKCV